MSTRRQFLGSGAATMALAGVAISPLRTRAQDATPAPSLDDSPTSGPPVVGTPLFNPTIDVVKAQQVALDGNPGTVVTKVELDGEDGVLEYAVQLDNGIEVTVDATSGAITKTEPSGNGSDDDHGNQDSQGGDESDNGGDQQSNDDGGEGGDQEDSD